MRTGILEDLAQRAAGLVDEGLFKSERVIASPQAAHITLRDGSAVLNLCANNYLGLADHPALIEAAHAALDAYGYGMASVRFICGTQTVHKELEAALSAFLGTDDTILYSSCFDANGGLFETILDEQDCVISDSLNHASIIDGIRLSKAQRMRYDHLDNGDDMVQLEQCLRDAAGARYRLIATDGVFSMDGVIANLSAICDLAEREFPRTRWGIARHGEEVVSLAMEYSGLTPQPMFVMGQPEGIAAVLRDVVRPRAAYVAAKVESLPACLLYTSPSPRDRTRSRMPSSA